MIEIPGYSNQSIVHENVNSVVIRATCQGDNAPVMLKLLKQDYPKLEDIARYKLEYNLLRTLNLKGVVKAKKLEKYKNTLAIVFEDDSYESLKKFIIGHQLTFKQRVKIAIQIAHILSQLHSLNIIHNDIKPDNIIIHPKTKQVKIIDFGLATVLSRETPTVYQPTIAQYTLAYISPEQTGRMNCAVDYRTDFYSLGVTLYELFTNKLPFEAEDAIELVHCHLAKQAIAPHLLNPQIFPALGNIILKLLAKTAEQRYQSAWGIQVDLQNCLRQLQATDKIVDFPLAQQDFSEKFRISQKLYGREKEIETLKKVINRVSQGTSEILLIAGYSGVGKSALVQEIYKPLTQKEGYFISGKFDQFQKDIPYRSLIQAFRDLVRQILTQSEAQIAIWQEKLLTGLKSNGQLIIDIIPEVELIIGSQPPLLKLEPAEAENRFSLVFQNFVNVFTQKEHPLVIFLDDLQWADTASLQFIERVLSQRQGKYLLLIGAYRDNEVNSAHRLVLTLEKLKQSGIAIEYVHLEPLKVDTVNQLLVDSLKAPKEYCLPLAELVLKKTGGNPFFLKEFLKYIHEKRYLYFNFQSRSWCWNLEALELAPISDNVVDLMTAKIKLLPEKTQEILKLAACIGNHFDLQTLSYLNKTDLVTSENILWQAVQENLIVPVDNTYKLVQAEVIRKSIKVFYKFAHDRIQQAAYSLIPSSDKASLHLRIGNLLLQHTTLQNQQERIFEIVNHLNFGAELIHTQEEREALAQLNLLAGRKAKASTAYQAAFTFFQKGLVLLTENRWSNQYNLSLELSIETAETAYLSGNFDEMERIFTIVKQEAAVPLDKVKIYEVKIAACIAMHEFIEAVNLGLTILSLLGIKFPSKANKFNILLGLANTQFLLFRKNIEDLLQLPEIVNPNKKAAIEIINQIASAAYLAVPNLFPLLNFKGINLSLKYGKDDKVLLMYSFYGVLLCGIVGDVNTGYKFGQLALKCLENFSYKQVAVRTLVAVNYGIKHWREHCRETLNQLSEAFTLGIEMGDLEYAYYAAGIYLSYSFMVGKKLTTIERETYKYEDAAQKFHQKPSLNNINMSRQLVLNLLGRSENIFILEGEAYSEKERLEIDIVSNEKNAVFHNYVYKLILCYLFENYDEANLHSAWCEKYIEGGTGTMTVPVFYFYDSLTRLALYHTLPKFLQKKALNRVRKNQKKMKRWAHYAPMNHLHKFQLVEAELYRALGDKVNAIDAYDRAIALAKENEYLNEEALARELAAKFYLSLNKETLAKVYLQDAYYCYQTWGATAKVKDLEQRYPQLLQTLESNLSGKLEKNSSFSSSSRSGNSETLDLATITKASIAIAEEIVLDALLAKLMRTLIENAGAEKGYLILETQGQLLIEAEGTVESEGVAVLQSIPISHSISVSSGIINYVARTKETIVLNDASYEGQFTLDAYIKLNQPKSVLCIPLINQGKLVGIAYFENNLTTNAFTNERLEVLSLLSTQAAISIENARFYSTLEARVAERTHELKEAQAQLQYRASFENLLSSISRYFIDGNADIAIQLALKAIARFMNADRSCIAEFITAQKRFDLVYEWSAAGVTPLFGEAKSSYIEDFPHGYQQILAGNSVQYPSIAQLPDEMPEKRLFESQGIQSVAIVPMLHSGEVVGFLGVDMVGQTRTWNQEEIALLKLVGEVIAIGRARHQAEEALVVAKEAAETANRTKSVFLANMSHELRTPLNAILGFAQLMARDAALSGRLRDYVGSINRSGEHLLNLINDVLEMSKIEAGQIVLSPVSFDLHRLLQTIEEMFSIRAQAKQLFLKFEIAADVPQYVEADEGKLRQVLINLLANAVKFTQTGGVTLSVSVMKSEAVSDPDSNKPVQIYFEVKDTGEGIAPEEIERLFQPFVQTSSGRHATEGTGLGLAISRQFVELMGGDIRCTSKVGQGSSFCFWVDVILDRPPQDVDLPVKTRRVLKLASHQTVYRILVVDDRQENRELLLQLLQSVGFETKSATNGTEAIALWQEWHPHLIWMDMRMPMMDGYEATKRIKAWEKEQGEACTVIIALTASAFEEQRANILAAGCDDFVRKPFQEQIIFDTMAQYLGVEYIYNEDSETETKLKPLQPSDLNVMPEEWRAELYQSALEVDAERILQLIEQIPETDLALAEGLTDLVNRFCFDDILALIENLPVLEV